MRRISNFPTITHRDFDISMELTNYGSASNKDNLFKTTNIIKAPVSGLHGQRSKSHRVKTSRKNRFQKSKRRIEERTSLHMIPEEDENVMSAGMHSLVGKNEQKKGAGHNNTSERRSEGSEFKEFLTMTLGALQPSNSKITLNPPAADIRNPIAPYALPPNEQTNSTQPVASCSSVPPSSSPFSTASSPDLDEHDMDNIIYISEHPISITLTRLPLTRPKVQWYAPARLLLPLAYMAGIVVFAMILVIMVKVLGALSESQVGNRGWATQMPRQTAGQLQNVTLPTIVTDTDRNLIPSGIATTMDGRSVKEVHVQMVGVATKEYVGRKWMVTGMIAFLGWVGGSRFGCDFRWGLR